MNFKNCFYLITLFFSLTSFAQSRDTLRCNGILEDKVLYNIQDAYQFRLNQPPPTLMEFGCGTAAYQYEEQQTCETAELILSKYPFLLQEINNLKSEFPNYRNLSFFWIDKNNIETKTGDFTLNEKDLQELEEWKSVYNHRNFSTVIISEKKSKWSEVIKIEIKISNKTTITKYELTYKNKWLSKKVIWNILFC